MPVDIFADLPENNFSQIDEAVLEYIKTSYPQYRSPNSPLLHTLLNRWRRLAMVCVSDSMWRIHWPHKDHRIYVKPDQVPYSLVVSHCGSEEKANHFIEITLAMQVWLPSSEVDHEHWWNSRDFPWVHRYVRDVLAYQWAIEHIERNDHHNLRNAYTVLGNLPERPEFAIYLKAGLQHPNLWNRKDAIKPAVKIMGHKAVPFLIQSVNEDNIHLKAEVIEALCQFPSPETTEILLSQFDMELAPWVRSTLIKAFGEIGDKRAIEPLTLLLHNPTEDDWFRGEVAVSLALLGPQTYDTLQPYLKDDTLRDYHKKTISKILDENQQNKNDSQKAMGTA